MMYRYFIHYSASTSSNMWTLDHYATKYDSSKLWSELSPFRIYHEVPNLPCPIKDLTSYDWCDNRALIAAYDRFHRAFANDLRCLTIKGPGAGLDVRPGAALGGRRCPTEWKTASPWPVWPPEMTRLLGILFVCGNVISAVPPRQLYKPSPKVYEQSHV